MVRSHYLPEKTYRVPLTGYSTYRGNSIYFRFKGHATKRTYSLSGYDLTNICERYDVELYLKEPLPTVYYVCGISLCKRDSISKQLIYFGSHLPSLFVETLVTDAEEALLCLRTCPSRGKKTPFLGQERHLLQCCL